jgi:hypothetical protein
VRQQLADRHRLERAARGSQPDGAEVPAHGVVQVKQAAVTQLHDGDRRERLGDRADPEDRVLGDRSPLRAVRDAGAAEELQPIRSNDRDGQPGRRMLVQNLVDD